MSDLLCFLSISAGYNPPSSLCSVPPLHKGGKSAREHFSAALYPPIITLKKRVEREACGSREGAYLEVSG